MNRWLKRSLWLLSPFLIAAAVLPYIPVGALREPIHRALENALGRKVEIGEVRLSLLPKPGFTMLNVTIGEDPSIGPEPMAYVTTMHAVPGISALFGGPLTFWSVDLEDASLNLTRIDRPNDKTNWNFSTLASPRLLAAFPTVHMRGGRINFKFNDTKSVFYLLDTDIDLWPPASLRGSWTLRLRGQPARTDRPARGFGIFTAKGAWDPRENGVALDLTLVKSQLSDLLTLFNGQETGIYGEISGNAHLAGPVSRIGFAGRINVANIHGWDQLPPGGGAWPLAISGAINAPGQILDLNAGLDAKQSPFALHYRVSDYLRKPRWGVTANVNRFPVAPLTGLARNLGARIPNDFKLDGSVSGAVGYSMPEGLPRMDGQLSVTAASVSVSGSPRLRIPQADLRFSGSTVTLAPARILNTDTESALVDASWDAASRHLEAELASQGMSIASLRAQTALAGIPFLGAATAGIWSGHLRYVTDPGGPAAGWQGEIHLEAADIPFEAFAQPIHVASADASMNGAALDVKQVSLSLDGIAAQGEYHYDPAALRPHRFRLSVASADAGRVEKLLLPTLHRGNFINYAFNFGRVPEPDWLRLMKADGSIQAARLTLAGQDFTALRARVIWDGDRIQLSSLSGRLGAAAFVGRATIQLAERQPVYSLEGKLADLPWHSGLMNADVALKTSGTGLALFENLRANGSFQGRSIEFNPLDSYDSVAGTFDWGGDARKPRLRLSQLVLKSGVDIWQGAGDMDDAGRITLRLNDGSRQVQTAGAILSEALKP
jgi:AsmA protein